MEPPGHVCLEPFPPNCQISQPLWTKLLRFQKNVLPSTPSPSSRFTFASSLLWILWALSGDASCRISQLFLQPCVEPLRNDYETLHTSSQPSSEAFFCVVNEVLEYGIEYMSRSQIHLPRLYRPEGMTLCLLGGNIIRPAIILVPLINSGRV